MTDDTTQIQDEEEKEEETQDDQISEWENKYKRALADYQNLEKRVRDERGDLIRSANKDIILRFLPILDTLLMAGLHSEDQTLKICTQQFLDTLKREGIIRMETIGQHFDPTHMEVITTQNGEKEVVISEVRAGFLLHDKLLRPAQVIVGNGEKE